MTHAYRLKRFKYSKIDDCYVLIWPILNLILVYDITRLTLGEYYFTLVDR